MDGAEISLLDLPPLRGNPFELRPIESLRAQDIVGRDSTLTRLREHAISESPRLIFLVGERGSGRTSLINALSSQVNKKFVGQYWPEDDPVNSVMHEIAIHFLGYEVPPSMGQLCERLIDTLEQGTGTLPLIALDYPSNVQINDFLTRMAPLLQRLRALVVVTLTPAQLTSLDEETLDIFDPPVYLEGLSAPQIQKMSDNLVRRKAREGWNIKSELLRAIHSNTGGNPREVVRLLRDLVDERRDTGSKGTLQRLMGWQKPPVADEDEPPTAPLEVEEISEPETEPSTEEDDWDTEPDDMWEDEAEPEEGLEESWEEELPDPEDMWDEESEDEETIVTQGDQETLDSFVSMQEGTEPPEQLQVRGLSGLLNRSVRVSDSMPEGPDDTPITYAEKRPQLTPIPLKAPPKPEPLPAFVTEAKPDISISSPEEMPVMTAEGALWTMDPSLGSSLPDLDAEQEETLAPVFDIEHIPPPPPAELESVFVEPEPTPVPPKIPITMGPKWDDDEPLDRTRAASLSDAERLILSAAGKREISPSDSELQARLEVGRPRLSQIYNGLRKAGLLSVRKQGRTRLFKLSHEASLEFKPA